MSELQTELLAVAGVNGAEVELADEGPVAVRVEVAADADRSKVAEDVQAILQRRGLSSRVLAGGVHRPEAPQPSTGDQGESRPRVVVSDGIRAVAVSEGPEGCEVVLAGFGGRRVSLPSENTPAALVDAVATGVARLLDIGDIELLSAEWSSVKGATIVTVAVRHEEEVKAGASTVAATRPYALAQALWRALSA